MRMIDSQDPEVATVGARQACLAALDLEEAASTAYLCLSGSEAQKVGAAPGNGGQRHYSYLSFVLRGLTD